MTDACTTNNYPVITFWNKEVPPLEVINEGDLRLKPVLKILGIEKTGLVDLIATSDRNEILSRQSIFRWLQQNPDFMDKLLELNLPSDIPTKDKLFLHDFHPDREQPSLFLEILHEYHTALQRTAEGDVPPEVKKLIKFLNENFGTISELEKNFSKQVVDLSRTTVSFNSIISLTVDKRDVKLLEDNTLGYHLYGYAPLDYKPWTIDSGFFPKIPLPRKWKQWVVERLNKSNDQSAYGPQVIDETPESLKKIVADVVGELFKNVRNESNHTWDVKLGLTYEYGRLFVKIVDIQLQLSGIKHKDQKDEYESQSLQIKCDRDFPGYSQKNTQRFLREVEALKEASTRDHLANVKKAKLLANLFSDEKTKHFFSKSGVEVSSDDLSSRFAYNSITALCSGQVEKGVGDMFNEANACRQYISGLFNQLIDMTKIIRSLDIKSKDWKTTLSFPEILDDNNHVFSSDNLFPFHLAVDVDPSNIIPVGKLPDIADNIISITGHNAGGKTVVLETIATSLYLAQCGLPVFGTNVKFNAKQAMGLVFIERGSGSTAELLLRKLKALLDKAKESKPSQCITIIDELGGGTQEAQGIELSDKVLKTLADSGCSVVFSTQITELVKRLERSGLISLNIDRSTRKITEGIGTGEIDELAKDIDLFSENV